MTEAERAAREVLHHINPDAAGGIPAGSFITALLNAWGRADRVNSARLAAAFPEYARPVDMAKHLGTAALTGWIDTLMKVEATK